jgi:hypothetical protein
VEFVMRRHAVILAAALVWLVSIEGAEARLDILVDKATQRMLVIQNGYMRYMWPVSTGRDETATPNGVYTPQRLERSWFSSAYYNSPMPYSIFFHNGYAIHGSYAIDRLGGPASHGCVRLHPHHAALLFDLVQQEGPDKTTIEITDEAGPRQPPFPPREIAAAGQGQYPPGIVRYRENGDTPEPPPVLRGNRPEEPPLPPREIGAGRGPYPPMPRLARYRDNGDMPEPPSILRSDRPEEAPLPPREIGAGRSPYPPMPRLARYRDNGDMPEPPPVLRGNRPLAARNSLPPPPPLSPPPGRRMLTEVRPPATAPPAAAPRAAAEADAASEPSDIRPSPKPRVAEASPSAQAQAQQAPPKIYGFKLLPSSCWSGGASRWRLRGSSQGVACK